MQYRRLGDSGLKVSAVSVGGWMNYGESKVPEDDARKVIETAYEQGINFFDLADIYGRGDAEQQMGGVLRNFQRHTLVISSKLFWPMSEDINDRGLSRKHIFESIDRSLKRLGTDYLDIYFCHRYDPETPVLETIRAMNDLIRLGKVIYWGTSEWSGENLQEAYDLCEKYGLVKPQSEQPQYSMLWRQRVEEDVLPVAESHGTGLVVWSPLGQGMLTGKYDGGVPSGSRFDKEAWAKDRFMTDENIAKVQSLKPLADELGITRSQLALAWVLRQPGISSVITGATKPKQVIENVKAADIQLAPEVIAQIDEIIG